MIYFTTDTYHIFFRLYELVVFDGFYYPYADNNALTTTTPV